ncbi:MAG TPA: TRAP transporter small permease subunit [Burkholderiales bacterium]|nr:TRAP transporter small permease subunit [Burkholderiales bacterium]
MPASTSAARGERDFPGVFYGTIRTIDRFTDATGRLFALSQLALVAIVAYEVTSRYFFRAPTVWAFEASTMTNGAAFMLACGYALYKGAHVRTDIFWENFSQRRRGIIDLLSYLVLFFPTMVYLVVVGTDGALHSYQTGERSQESMWRATMWPFRAAIPLAALLFMVQGVSESLKCLYQIRFGREFEHREKLEV